MFGSSGALIGRGIGGAAAAVAALALLPASASASTVCNSGCDFSSIQAAVTAASPGTTIDVSAGTYNENVVVDKPLTIDGAQAGVDARTRTGAQESILSNSAGAFNIQANNVTIDGFTLQEQTGLNQGAAVVVTNQYSGYQILNNIITNNHFGVYANSSGVFSSEISRNLFADNNAPGSASGNGIYADQGTKNLTIDQNKFTGQQNTGVLFAGTDPLTQTGIQVTDNQDISDAGFVFYNASDVTVSGNTITNDDVGSAIVAGSNDSGMLIQNNRVARGAYSAVRVADFLGGGPNSNITAIGNTLIRNGFGFRETDSGTADAVVFQFNRVVGNDVGAENVLSDPGTQTEAQNNWWGCNEGPDTTDCQTLNGNIDATPWLVLSLSAYHPRIKARTGHTRITASLRMNSDGVKPTGNVFPDGTPIVFGSSLATTLDATRVLTDNAVASTTLHAGTKTGTSHVKARLDNEKVFTNVVVH